MFKSKLILELISILAFFTVLFMVVYLGKAIQNVEHMEERLSYSEPALAAKGQVIDDAILHQTYVPAYSHIYINGGQALLLETTLSIRNPHSEDAVTLHSVEYFDTNGKLVKSYLDKPVKLPAMAAAEYLAEKKSITGGSGASFIVKWSGVSAPLIESVMVGMADKKSVSFTSRGLGLVPEAD